MKNIFENHPPSPLIEVRTVEFERKKVRIFVKRDDLLHPHISGNKWRKLKYNLLEAKRLGAEKIVTFGGAFSNHLAAVAAAGSAFGFSTMGVVRGERMDELNPTLRYVEACGMELMYVSRTNFRKKSNVSLLEDLKINLNTCYVLPEGGTNCLALLGCGEMVGEVEAQFGGLPDYFCVTCGTGGTLSGIVSGLAGRAEAVGISVLKGDFMKEEVTQLLKSCGSKKLDNWQVFDNYHFGGYAKFNPGLIEFIRRFQNTHNIPLDPVYTGKLFFAAFDLAEKGFFKKDSTVLLVHTGGLQGVAGFNERYPEYRLNSP